jgi:hypothetical protein
VRRTWDPAATDPVNETASARSTSAAPAAPPPVTSVNTPSGSASAKSSASRSATAGDCSAGLSTTPLPNARAGAAFHSGIATGKFHGVIRPATPCGRRRVCSSETPSAAGKTSPSGSRAACAKYRRIATPRATSPDASPIGLPTSRTTRADTSPAAPARASAQAPSAAARSVAGRRAQPVPAARVRSTAAVTSSAPPSGTVTTRSPGACGERLSM